MLPAHADRISIVAPRALSEAGRRRSRAREDACKREEWELSRLSQPRTKARGEKGYAEMRGRLAQFERELRRGNSKRRRLVRNRHVLLPTTVVLSVPEAREAVARDPGLRFVGHLAENRVCLIRWDAGCSSCGSAFELGGSGKPVTTLAVADGQLSLFSASDSPLWEILEEGEGGRTPTGFVRCPCCGRSSKLGRYAMELAVAFAWPIVTISSWVPPFGREGDVLGISHRIAPFCHELQLNLATGKVQHGLTRVSKSRLGSDAARNFDEYPISEAVARLLAKNGVEFERVKLGCSMPINDLIEATLECSPHAGGFR